MPFTKTVLLNSFVKKILVFRFKNLLYTLLITLDNSIFFNFKETRKAFAWKNGNCLLLLPIAYYEAKILHPLENDLLNTNMKLVS